MSSGAVLRVVLHCILFLDHSSLLTMLHHRCLQERLQDLLDRQSGLPPPSFIQRVKAMLGMRRPDARAE